MKEYINFFIRALPLTIGVFLSLTGLCFLTGFYDSGLDFSQGDFWLFSIFFIIGFPLLIFGVDRLSNYSSNHVN